jgi:hypothetical protein
MDKLTEELLYKLLFLKPENICAINERGEFTNIINL